MKVKNIALAIAVLGFAIGFSDADENMLVWLGRPVGAIFAIVYFICAMLEKPFAEFDAENGIATKPTAAKAKPASAAGLKTAVS